MNCIAARLSLTVLGCALLTTPVFAQEPVRIGVITDMSGPYRDLVGPGFVTAVEMAIKDYGGAVLGRSIELLTVDDQTKPDIAAGTARQWYNHDDVQVIIEGSNSATAVAIQGIALELQKLAIVFSGATVLTNENCSPYGVQYAWDNYSLANGAARALTSTGGDSWYFITADYAFGHSMESEAIATVREFGGEVLGTVRHPINTHDFASFVLSAQQSGAKVVALANAGRDTQTAVLQAREFGLDNRLAPLLTFDTDVRAMGLEVAQGLTFVTGYYWDFDDQTREFGERFFELHNAMPTMNQAGAYSAMLHYLNAVDAAGTTEPETVMAKMKETPIDDFFGRGGYIREDGRMIHDMYLVEVKSPENSSGDWDMFEVINTIPGEEAFMPLEKSKCEYIKNKQ